MKKVYIKLLALTAVGVFAVGCPEGGQPEEELASGEDQEEIDAAVAEQSATESLGGAGSELPVIATPEAEPIPEPIEILVNFGKKDNASGEEDIFDFGAAYDEDQGYGWVNGSLLSEGTVERKDISRDGRQRNKLKDDLLSDSLLHFHKKGQAAWELDLPNGDYQVTLVAGDPSYTDSVHVINIEGINAISDFAPTKDQRFMEATIEITVGDGKLTMDAIGGKNSKINYLKITNK